MEYDEQSDYVHARLDESERVIASRGNIGDPEAAAYLASRGITAEKAEEWGLGYDVKNRRIVIPWKGYPWYHVDRDITGTKEKDGKYWKPSSALVGKQPIWNSKAIKEADTVVVVEGALDALAVGDCGFEAVALGSTKATDVVKAAAERGKGLTVLVMTDNDEAGRRAAFGTFDEAAQAGATVCVVGYGDAAEKDPFAIWQRDPSALRGIIEAAQAKAAAEAVRNTMRAVGVMDPRDVANGIMSLDGADAEPVPTGLESFDKAMDGGIYPGLVVIMAISSMGKTKLMVNVADNMARATRPVLFVSVEQSAREIVAMSLSRIMWESTGVSVPARGLMSKAKRAEYGPSVLEAMTKANQEYHDAIAPWLWVMEPVGRPSVGAIRLAAQAQKEVMGVAPVVFVDYLQLLNTDGGRDVRVETEKNVTELRQLSRDLVTPVIAISSIGRKEYDGELELGSAKEAGGIEFSADLALGLQPRDMRVRGRNAKDAERTIEATKMQRPWRELELKVLKSRNGEMCEPVPVWLDAAHTLAVGSRPKDVRPVESPVVI